MDPKKKFMAAAMAILAVVLTAAMVEPPSACCIDVTGGRLMAEPLVPAQPVLVIESVGPV